MLYDPLIIKNTQRDAVVKKVLRQTLLYFQESKI